MKLKLSKTAEIVLNRYLTKDENGNITEKPEDLFKRIAKNLAKEDFHYGATRKEIAKTEKEFLNAMLNMEFLPNLPTIANAGRKLQQLAACFVIPVPDSTEGIFQAIKELALIQRTGGGTGFSFSQLRPEGSHVSETGGIASGPVSFMKVFDCATAAIKEGGIRRGANMGILRVDHPDIEKFIKAKERGDLPNFNISVAITDKFMEATKKDTNFDLVFDKKVYKTLKARELLDKLCKRAWINGDPGVIFIDKINKFNPTPKLGEIEATNPCVTKETLISTNSGLIKAGELAKSQKEIRIILDSRLSKATYTKASNVFVTGTKPVFRLTTKEGYELKLTKDHKVLTTKGWIEAKDLQKNDEILIQNRKGLFGKVGNLQEGRVLGWLVGDGTFSTSKGAILSFFANDKILAPEFANYVSAMVGGQISAVQIKGRNETRVSSIRLQKIAKSFGFMENNKITVPTQLLSASEHFQKGFLQGVFSADGHISGTLKKGHSARLTSISASFLKDIQRMLINFGIASKLYLNRHEERNKLLPDGKGGQRLYKCQPDHDLVISKNNLIKFLNEIGFISPAKQNRLITACGSFTRGPYEERFIARFDKLVPEGIETVYDLKEPITNSFIANGLVVHNCGEQPLLPYESCILGSINISKFIKNKKINFRALEKVIITAIHLLDNSINASSYPIPEIENIVRRNRKIGLGIMGFADALVNCDIAYDSKEAEKFALNLMKFVKSTSHKASAELAKRKTPFSNFRESIYKNKPLRNAALTTIAPTGTIALIAHCSEGIEPMFAPIAHRHSTYGVLEEIDSAFEELQKRQKTDEMTIAKIEHEGTLQNTNLPEKIKKVFKASMDISPEWHVRIQAAFQKHTDNAISKTVNLPEKATPEDIKKTFLLAYDLGCKGITIYRYHSKREQVLEFCKQCELKK